MRFHRPNAVPTVTTTMSPSPAGLGIVSRDRPGIVVAH
jgi:hypothetical protein